MHLRCRFLLIAQVEEIMRRGITEEDTGSDPETETLNHILQQCYSTYHEEFISHKEIVNYLEILIPLVETQFTKKQYSQ